MISELFLKLWKRIMNLTIVVFIQRTHLIETVTDIFFQVLIVIFKFVIYGFELVGTPCLSDLKKMFSRLFLIFLENVVTHNFQDYVYIYIKRFFLISNSKHGKKLFFHVLNFEKNRSKIATVRMPIPVTAKMGAMTWSNLNFLNRRKTY